MSRARERSVWFLISVRTPSAFPMEAYEAAVAFIKETYGDAFVNPERIVYKSKGKTQDAHEAIRPTNVSRTPESIKDSLSKDQYRLYKLIWERFVASQMSPAVYDTLSVKLSGRGLYLPCIRLQTAAFPAFWKPIARARRRMKKSFPS